MAVQANGKDDGQKEEEAIGKENGTKELVEMISLNPDCFSTIVKHHPDEDLQVSHFILFIYHFLNN